MKPFAQQFSAVRRHGAVTSVDAIATVFVLVVLVSLSSSLRVGSGKVTSPVSVTTFINQSPGFIDGVGTVAKFFNPIGIATSTDDNAVYIADSGNNAVRQLSSTGVVTTVVGKGPLNPGYEDGRMSMALLDGPTGIAVDDITRNLYIVDQNNHAIRCLSLFGSVITTLAGGPISGFQDGVGTNARFLYPTAIVLGLYQSVKTLYISDSGNHCIRRMTLSGSVAIIAGYDQLSGNIDGQGTLSRFARPQGMYWYEVTPSLQYLYVTDPENHNLRYLMFSSNSAIPDVSTLAGNGTSGFVDATGTQSLFSSPSGVALIAPGVLGIADTGNNAIRRFYISTSSTISYAGAGGGDAPCALIDGASTVATLCGPRALLLSPTASTVVIVSDTNNHALRIVSPLGSSIATAAGQGSSSGGLLDGVAGTTAKMRNPASLWYSSKSKDLYFSDSGNHAIRKLSPSGNVTLVAGSVTGVSGYVDGTASRMWTPYGIAGDESGSAPTLYFSDSENNAIRVVVGDRVSTLAGTVTWGFADGASTVARFWKPAGVTLGQFATPSLGPTLLYLCDRGNHVIRRVSLLNGTVNTICGQSAGPGFSDGMGTGALFHFPTGIAFSAFHGGYLVADAQNNIIRLVTPHGVVSTLAGDYRYSGLIDDVGTNALFRNPQGLAVTSTGTIYVSDTSNAAIRSITPYGKVTTVCGAFPINATGFIDGTGTAARLSSPTGMAVVALPDSSSSSWYLTNSSSLVPYVLFADLGNNAVRRFRLNGDGYTKTTSESSSSSLTTSGSLSELRATRSQSVTLAGATGSETASGAAASGTRATQTEVFTLSRSRSFGAVSQTNTSSHSLGSPTLSRTSSAATRSTISTSASRPSPSGKRHCCGSISFPTPSISVSATEMCFLHSVGLGATAPTWSSLQGAANTTSSGTEEGNLNHTATRTTIEVISSLWEMTPVPLVSIGASPPEATPAVVVSADAIPFSAAILSSHTFPLVFQLRLVARRQWRLLNASRAVDNVTLRVVALPSREDEVTMMDTAQDSGSDGPSSSMGTPPLPSSALQNVSSTLAVGLVRWEADSAAAPSSASASSSWLGVTVSAYRWSTVGVKLALGCAAGSVTNVVLNIPVRPLPLPPSTRVAETSVHALQGLSTLGSTSTVPSLSRVAATRRMMLCSPDGAVSGGILGLSIERGLSIDAGDATVAGARGAIVGNVIWVLSAAVVLQALGVWFAGCSRRAMARRTPLRTFAVVGALRVALPSSLLPAWLAALPSSAGGAAYLVAWSVSRETPLDGVDVLLVVVGVFWTVIPLAGLWLAQWIARSALRLQLRPRPLPSMKERKSSATRGEEKDADTERTKCGLWALWRKVSFRTEEWWTSAQRAPAQRSTAAIGEAEELQLGPGTVAAVIDAGSQQLQPSRRARRSRSMKRSVTNIAAERSLWVLLLEYRVLWFAAYDATAFTAASALSVAVSFSTAAACEGSMILVLFLFVTELLICWRIRPFTSVRSHVYCLYTLGCTSLSLVFQIVFLAKSKPIPTAMWSLQVATALDIVVAVTAVFRLAVFDAPQMLSSLRRFFREARREGTLEWLNGNSATAPGSSVLDCSGAPTDAPRALTEQKVPHLSTLVSIQEHGRRASPLVLLHDRTDSSSDDAGERRASGGRSEKIKTPLESSVASSRGSPATTSADAGFAVNDSFGVDRMLPSTRAEDALQDLVLHYRRAEAGEESVV